MNSENVYEIKINLMDGLLPICGLPMPKKGQNQRICDYAKVEKETEGLQIEKVDELLNFGVCEVIFFLKKNYFIFCLKNNFYFSLGLHFFNVLLY